MKHSIALIGFGGYGSNYLRAVIENPMPDKYSLIAAVDFRPEAAPDYPWLVENKVPVYATMAEMYANHRPDYVIISTPVMAHLDMITEAMENGSNVLCEKPLFPRIQDVYAAREVMERTGKKLGVGFQWSYAQAMIDLKTDIMAGALGAPVRFSGHVAWQRFDRYFARWTGTYRLDSGDYVCDTVVSNATAHYLHNILWLAGETLDTSATPVSARASVYRAKDIETYDTAFIRGRFASGAEFYYSASHSVDKNVLLPYIRYEFENATVTYVEDGGESLPRLIATFKDGSVKEYGAPNDNYYGKTFHMMDIIDGEKAACCGLEAIVPHLKVCNAILEKCPVNFFPEELKIRAQSRYRGRSGEADEGTFISGLGDRMREMFEQNLLPDETGDIWAAKSIELGNLEEYSAFKGKYE